MSKFPFLLICICCALVCTPPVSAKTEVIYFYQEGCPKCESVSLILDELVESGSIHVTAYDVTTKDGYNLFKEYNLTVTPALIINGKTLEGDIERSDILKALQGIQWYHFLLALLLGLLSGLSPTLMEVYTDIISEVANTTRQEMDVAIRSLLFCAGILMVVFCLFLLLTSIFYLNFLTAALGFAVFINLFNSGLHTFNSYTRIDIFIRKKFIALDDLSVVKLGLLHGIGKFSDSVPFFVPLLYIAITEGSFTNNFILFGLFAVGVVLSFVMVLMLAIVQINLFKKFVEQRVTQAYFILSGLVVMVTSVWLFWLLIDTINLIAAFVLVALVAVSTGVLIGYRRRIIY